MTLYIIDDVFGDSRPGSDSPAPVFAPVTGQWDPLGGTCSICTLGTNLPISIDPTQAQNGTWHTVTVSEDEPTTTITIKFTGTSATAFFMLPPDFGRSITSFMNMTCELDGETIGSLQRTATSDDWTYRAPLCSKTNLENTEHTFVVQPLGGASNSYMVFDYLEYEFDEPTSTSSTATSSPEGTSPTSTPPPASAPPPNTSIPTAASPTSSPTSSTSNNSPSVTSESGLTSNPGQSTAPAPESSSPADSNVTNSGTGNTLPFSSSAMSSATSFGAGASSTSTAPGSSIAGHAAHSASHVSTAAIVGVVVGTVLAIAVAAFLVLCVVRRRKRRREGSTYEQDPPSPTAYNVQLPQQNTPRRRVYEPNRLMEPFTSGFSTTDPPSSVVPAQTSTSELLLKHMDGPQVLHTESEMSLHHPILRAEQVQREMARRAIDDGGINTTNQRLHSRLENLVAELENLSVAWRRREDDTEDIMPSEPPPSYHAASEDGPP